VVSAINGLQGNHEDGDIVTAATEIAMQDGSDEGRVTMNQPRIIRKAPA
jgi:hypothetical protein